MPAFLKRAAERKATSFHRADTARKRGSGDEVREGDITQYDDYEGEIAKFDKPLAIPQGTGSEIAHFRNLCLKNNIPHYIRGEGDDTKNKKTPSEYIDPNPHSMLRLLTNHVALRAYKKALSFNRIIEIHANSTYYLEGKYGKFFKKGKFLTFFSSLFAPRDFVRGAQFAQLSMEQFRWNVVDHESTLFVNQSLYYMDKELEDMPEGCSIISIHHSWAVEVGESEHFKYTPHLS